MLRKIPQFHKDEFIRANTVFFFGTFVVAVFNYLYHPVLSRMLSVEDFGEIQAAFSLAVQVGLLFLPIGYIVINITASQEDSERKNIISALTTLTMYIALSVGLILIFFGSTLADALKFHSTAPFYAIAFIVATQGMYVIYKSHAQGLKDFVGVSVGNLIVALGRLVIAVLFVWLGFRVFGALGALVIAQILAMLYILFRIQKNATLPKIQLRLSRKLSSLLPELRYGLLVLASIGFVTILTNADVVIVKYLFPSDVAGLYGGISVIARTIFFLTGSIAAVLLPSVNRKNTSEENRRTFKKAFLLLIIIGGLAVAIFALAPEIVTRLFLGQKYASTAEYLPVLSVLAFVASIANLFFAYFLALRDTRLLYAVAVGAFVSIISLGITHSQPLHVGYGFLWGALAAVVMLSILYLRGVQNPQYASPAKERSGLDITRHPGF